MPGAPPPSATALRPLRSALATPTSRATKGYRKRSISVPTPPPPDLVSTNAHVVTPAMPPNPKATSNTPSHNGPAATTTPLSSATRNVSPSSLSSTAPAKGYKATMPSSNSSKTKLASNMGFFSTVKAHKWTLGTGMTRPASADTLQTSNAQPTAQPSVPHGCPAQSEAKATADVTSASTPISNAAVSSTDAIIEERNKEIATLQERANQLRSSFSTVGVTATTPATSNSTSGLSSSLPTLPSSTSTVSFATPSSGSDARIPRTLGEALQLVSSLRAKIHDLESQVELSNAENRALRHRNENLEDDMRSMQLMQRERTAAGAPKPCDPVRSASDWDAVAFCREREATDRAVDAAVAASNRARMLEELDRRRATAAAVPSMHGGHSMAHKRMRTGSFGNPVHNYPGQHLSSARAMAGSTGDRPKYFHRPLPHELPHPMAKNMTGSAGGAGGRPPTSLYAHTVSDMYNRENMNPGRNGYGGSGNSLAWTNVGSFR